ncbi:MAG: YdcF family protein [Bacteroidota bacterium]
MFFILSKILAFLLSPITWITVLLFFALFAKAPGRKRKFLLSGIFVLLFFSNTFIFDEFNRLWEYPAMHEKDLEGPFDAGIVLGSFTVYDPQYDRLQFNRGSDRLWQAVNLYKKGKIKKIIYVGGSGRLNDTPYKDGELIKRFLSGLGIPQEDILLETESMNTHENAVNAKKVIGKELPGGKYLLITSAFHMRRAKACFKKEGLIVTPYTTDRYTGKRKFQFDHAFIPNIYALHSWDNLIHEVVGMITYKIMGYA